MIYAQRNYLQLMGINPVYRIDQIGCLLVAICNVLEELRQGINPLSANANLRDRGLYINLGDAGNARHGLGWGSISQLNGNIVSVQHGYNSWPTSNSAIVKFVYKNARGATLTHFSKVADWSAKKILDSFDGVVKYSPYGQPVEWMVYASHAPTPIAPVVPAVVPPKPKPFPPGITYEVITELQLVPKDKPAPIWALTFTDWANKQQLGTIEMGETFSALGIAHHPLGGDYYIRKNDFGDADRNGGFPIANQGVNVVDMMEKPAPAPIPVAVPDPPLEVVAVPEPVPTIEVAPPVDKPFNETYEDIDLADYRSKKSQWITDFADPTNTTARVPIRVGNVVPVRGKFYVDGQWYLRSRNSVNNGRWLGLPEADMERVAVPSDEVDDKDIEAIDMSLTDEVKQLPKSTGQWLRNVLVGAIGTVSGIVERIALKNKNKKQETK